MVPLPRSAPAPLVTPRSPDPNTPIQIRAGGVSHSGAISNRYLGFEVDNCELWAWGTSAVSLGQGALDAHVHHNLIHHTRRAGLGYGVVLDRASALIEGNVFDACRHHIAATGRPGTSYEARYNLVLEHANGHGFDMHGAPDYDKTYTRAIWRFDEGEGLVAKDSSVTGYHPPNDCALAGMDPAGCWVPGVVNTGLEFDGVDDRLECNTDASLTSTQGSLTLWLSPVAGGLPAGLLTLSDAAGDGLTLGLDGAPLASSGSNGPAWTAGLTLAGVWVGDGPAGPYRGRLDEVRVYNRALAPDEIVRHAAGNPDIAGDRIDIHHNTFRDVEQSAVVIRGVPATGAHLHHNWFHLADPAWAVRQVYAAGNLLVEDNAFGPAGSLATPTGSLLIWLSGGPGTVFEIADATGSDLFTLSIEADGRVRVRILESGSTVVDLTSVAALPPSGFHHLALVQDGGGLELYINGAPVEALGLDGALLTGHIAPARAAFGAGEAGPFSGLLDEIRLTSDVLDAAAIAADHLRGPVLAAWSFDEGAGAVAADASGGGHDGALVNFDLGTAWVAGRVGAALDFDGVDDRVEAALPAALSTPEGTIALWFEADIQGDNRDLVNLFEDGFQNFLLLRRTSDGRILLLIEDDDAAIASVTTTTPVGPGWHHLAVTQDGNGLVLYVDGQAQPASGSNSGAWTNHLALTGAWLGAGHWSHFDGRLDEVSLWARALTPAEVAEHAGR